MDCSDSYFTIAYTSQSSIREKSSKFLGFAYPVTGEEEAKHHLELLRKEYYQANHHCYAYRIGHPESAVFRINDDGEPSGSAGKPIYGQILSRDLSDILVVVVRSFGGTKLGIPGLIRAYRLAATETLDSNRVITKVLTTRLCVTFPVQQMNAVMRILKQEDVEIIFQEYLENYCIHFSIRKSRKDLIKTKLSHYANIFIYE